MIWYKGIKEYKDQGYRDKKKIRIRDNGIKNTWIRDKGMKEYKDLV